MCLVDTALPPLIQRSETTSWELWITKQNCPIARLHGHVKSEAGIEGGPDEGLRSLAECHRLENVNLTWAIQIGDAGVTALASGCPHLRELSLHGITGITDAAITALGRFCGHSLRTLDVRGCSGVVGRDRASLLIQLPLLTSFQMHS
jgi:hypothetical protein